jgi:hypothetical protein
MSFTKALPNQLSLTSISLLLPRDSIGRCVYNHLWYNACSPPGVLPTVRRCLSIDEWETMCKCSSKSKKCRKNQKKLRKKELHYRGIYQCNLAFSVHHLVARLTKKAEKSEKMQNLACKRFKQGCMLVPSCGQCMLGILYSYVWRQLSRDPSRC